jgi:signal transduction histidine kinase
VHDALEPAVISGAPVLAEHPIANLIDNAVRYNIAQGDIWITTRTEIDRSFFTISNTGPTIGSDDVERIFQPFQRLASRTSGDGFRLG